MRQGSEGGNKALSQARAEAVLLALQGRRVDVSGMNAVGYGEATPIADNDNRRGPRGQPADRIRAARALGTAAAEVEARRKADARQPADQADGDAEGPGG
jgi:OmpA-OmpF porin, OOP family